MFYLIMRVFLLVIILVIIFLMFKNFILSFSKKGKIILLSICFIAFYISLLIPFESFALNFETAEAAFNYSFINQKIIKVVETDNCAFIFYGDDGSQINYTYINKNNDKYQVKSPYNMVNFESTIKGQFFINQIKNNKANEQLIVIIQSNLKLPSGEAKIEDNLNSTFSYFNCKYKNIDCYTDVYWTVVDSSDLLNYTLTIDDEEIKIG